MATDVNPYTPPSGEFEEEEVEDFRSVSRAAIASIVLMFLGISGYFVPAMLGLLLFGMAAGLLGYISAIRYPKEISGTKLGLVGLVGCLLLFVGFTSFHVYVYNTEVPEGYERVTWANLQPSGAEKKARMPIPQLALDMSGKKVFMKGYVMQPNGGRKTDLKEFILVRDIGSCCFGDASPKPTHIVKVDLPKGTTVDWSMRVRSLTGTLHVDSRQRRTNHVSTGVFYQLEADQVLK